VAEQDERTATIKINRYFEICNVFIGVNYLR
jgi:hypothetical protein